MLESFFSLLPPAPVQVTHYRINCSLHWKLLQPESVTLLWAESRRLASYGDASSLYRAAHNLSILPTEQL